MSDPFQMFSAIGQGLGGIAGLGSSVANFFQQGQTQQNNMAMFEQSRYDAAHAVETRAADMKAAGINPLLAAGSPAQAMSSPQLQAPQFDSGAIAGGLSEAGSAPLAALLKGAQLDQTKAQTDLLQAQRNKVDADTTGQNLSNQLATSLNPLKITQQQIQTNLDQATMPTKVAMLASQLKGVDLTNANTAMDTALKNANIDMNQLKQVEQGIQNKIAGVSLSTAQFANKSADYNSQSAYQDLLAKIIYVKTAGIDQDILIQLSKTNPGLANGISNWVNIVKGVIPSFGK